jgi:AcrR family transcriptional regulator
VSQKLIAQEEREQRILDATDELILRQGYDKTTMSDIAEATGIGRGVLYQHFKSKESLFEALLSREVLHYGQAWVEYIETDPHGGTIGSIYRAVLSAIKIRPLMAAMMRRDRRVIGTYLRKPGNLLASMQSESAWVETLRAMQRVGVLRQSVDPAIMACLMDMLAYGFVNIDEFRSPDDTPPFDVLIEAMADMMDRLLTPENGGNREEAKAILLHFAANARARLDQAMLSQVEKEREKR